MIEQERVRDALAAGDYEPYLRYIRFPRYKNLAVGSRIDFSYPVTAIVGPNGTNKTSILRAVHACRTQVSLGTFWFETQLDRIDDNDWKSRYIHGYRVPSGRIVEAVKTRVQKDEDPDYWEPSRPLLSPPASMAKIEKYEDTPLEDRPYRSNTRWNPIEKKVLHLDFRHDIPAFDLSFFFGAGMPARYRSPAEIKSFLRRRSKPLERAFSEGVKNDVYCRRERIIKPAAELSKESVHWVSKILGREYGKIQVLEHAYFGVDGITVRMFSGGLTYSEAFAGSGEYAVVRLVMAVLEAEEATLITLDEPEVSLHPAAQRKLMDFLNELSRRRKLQILIATHSPEIIRNLPPDAIKVLDIDPVTGETIVVSQETYPTVAFRRIGLDTQKSQVFVEDALAKAVVERAASFVGMASVDLAVEVLGGGDEIKTSHIPTLARTGANVLVFLDGDKAPKVEVPRVGDIPDADLPLYLGELGIRKKHLGVSGGNASNEVETRMVMRAVLQWMEDHVRYLPSANPETWLIHASGINDFQGDPKAYWGAEVDRRLPVEGGGATAADYLFVQRLALKQIPTSEPGMSAIMDVLRKYFRGQEPG